MVLINKRLAMFLRSGFTLFLALDLTITNIVHGFETKAKTLFTNRPKAKEIFVGDSVTFDWDYTREDLVRAVHFGITRKISNGLGAVAEEFSLLYKTVPGGLIYLNRRPEFKEIIHRTRFVYGKRASVIISNVRMNDTGVYFCKLKRKDHINDDVHHVNLKVVDLQIDEKASSSEEESWKNLKISLVCKVRVVKDESVTFEWLRQPNNQTLSRFKHNNDTRTESILTIITSADHHFTNYTCVAKTKRTTKFHNVLVKRLYEPGPPLNLQQKYIFDKDRGESFNKVYWIAPKINGGADVTDYIIEYKPREFDWGKATRVMTKKTMYDRFHLKEGKLYDVRVLARNKVDVGDYSNEVEIKLPNARFNSTGAGSNSTDGRPNSSPHTLYSTWWSCLSSFALLIAMVKW